MIANVQSVWSHLNQENWDCFVVHMFFINFAYKIANNKLD